MSKTVKNLMIRDYQARLEGVDDALVISLRGIPANDNNALRMDLQKKNIHISVIRNALAPHAFKDSGLAGLAPLLSGPSALAYGAESVVDVARAVMEWARKVEKLELKGAILDGTLFEGHAGVEALSKYPTREEALAQTVTLFLSPGRKAVGAIKGPGSKLASIIKTIEEKLEKGEAIGRIA
ncbi:MAG: 50S ribosomal protein L10 [Phycisphaerales bacterium]|nr:50S ribosomal protein L10 [Phycisphaerales bacterium]